MRQIHNFNGTLVIFLIRFNSVQRERFLSLYTVRYFCFAILLIVCNVLIINANPNFKMAKETN